MLLGGRQVKRDLWERERRRVRGGEAEYEKGKQENGEEERRRGGKKERERRVGWRIRPLDQRVRLQCAGSKYATGC